MSGERASQTAGAQFGNYCIEAQIGAGGFGAVFRARHIVTRKAVALKILSSRMRDDFPDLAARFRREASVGNEIAHPNVVEAYDAGEWQGQLYIAMELLEGRSLAAEIAAEGPMSPARALPLLEQICAGLEAAHRRGVVHRDLKPANVFLQRVDGGERVKLLDFGIAKFLHEPLDGVHTSSLELLGSPQTMSPEQCRGGAIDHRSDLYSLGAVAFYLVSGRFPFAGTQGEVLSAHLRDEPPRLGEWPRLDAIVQRLLAKDPAGRFGSAAEVRRAFAALAGPERPRAEPPSVGGPGPGWSGPIVGLGTVALCGLAWLGLRHWGDAPARVAAPVPPVVAAAAPPVALAAPPVALAAPPVALAAPSVALAAAPPPSPRRAPTVSSHAAPARILVNVRPWAHVAVDGEPRDDTPCSLPLTSGVHKLVVSNPALRRRQELKITLAPGEIKKLEFDWSD